MKEKSADRSKPIKLSKKERLALQRALKMVQKLADRLTAIGTAMRKQAEEEAAARKAVKALLKSRRK